MNTILLTGFDPFDGESINPSWEVAKDFQGKEIKNFNVVSKCLPTVYYQSSDLLKTYLKEYNPQIIINLGQAGGSKTIRIEKIAVNLNDARIKDNKGNQPSHEAIIEDGVDGYFSTLPVKELVDTLNEHNYPASTSLSAGAFVCNHIFYHLMNEIADKNSIGGFVHIPYIEEQTQSKENTFSMSLDQLKEALSIIINTSIDHYNRNNV